MITTGVIGVGSIGVHHARIYAGMPNVRLAGVVDIDASRAHEVASLYACKAYNDYRSILDEVDAVSIATPTSSHYQIGIECIKNNKHILMEKPVTSTLEEAEELISYAENMNCVLQVGHLERFNAGVSLISSMVENPQFIESKRLSPFPGRGLDVDVTLDLMIHDIDIILSLVNAEITDLRATGAKVLTNNIDIAHAWLEFANGCMAEAVTSRIESEKVRKLKIFQHNVYMDLDYQKQELTCVTKMKDTVKKDIKKPEHKEPLREQLKSFIHCIENNLPPVVSGYEGREALKVALKISGLVNHGLSL